MYKLPLSAEEIKKRLLDHPEGWHEIAHDEYDPTSQYAQSGIAVAQAINGLASKDYVDSAISAIPTPDVSGQIGTHNISTDAHNDIRLLINELTNRLNAIADSDDEDLDQISELVDYIKNNKNLIDGITTSKVSVNDIINNLTTNVSNKPLSAAQGVALKALIEEAKINLFDGTGVNSLQTANSTATGANALAEGDQTQATASNTHTEGSFTQATALDAHAEGTKTVASGMYSHAEGFESVAKHIASHAEGASTAEGEYSHAEGWHSKAQANNAHAEGGATIASGVSSHSEGENTVASGVNAHAEGNSTEASGADSHAEGYEAVASGKNTHAEGCQTQATNDHAHAEGNETIAGGTESHAEGYGSKAMGKQSHAEGGSTQTMEAASWAHAEGLETEAHGTASHAEGYKTKALHNNSHTEGAFTQTSRDNQHVEGQYNKDEVTAYHIIGCGADADNRDNCFTAGVIDGKKYIKVGNTFIDEQELIDLINAPDIYVSETVPQTTKVGTIWFDTSIVSTVQAEEVEF